MAWQFLGALALGGLQAGMGAAASRSAYDQQVQNYNDAKKFQKVSDKYAGWSAKINARVSNTSAKYKHFADLVQYNQDKSYINQLRNYELVKGINQAKLVQETRTSAMSDYVLKSQALSEGIREEATADAVAYYQYMQQGVRARSAVMANETEGASSDRIYQDYARQVGDMATLQQINRKFKERQFTREQAGQIAEYLSRYNSQDFYQQQPYQDPIRPFAPMPTLVMPPPPSMTGAGPSAAAANLNTASAILGGIQTGFSSYSFLNGLTGGGNGG
jgi:hypothetical protein